jgi:hypothetical protein
MWAFLWRGLVINLLSILGGGVTGFVMSFILGVVITLLGFQFTNVAGTIIGGASGFILGLVLFWVYVRWLFASNLAGYRLALHKDASDAQANDAATQVSPSISLQADREP